jgi:catechol 2,3-dioxygenase-like lactoylglutathione lyase family enzyme
MFSHVFIGVTDFDRALSFYAPLMARLGCPLKFVERERPWAGWKPAATERPLLLVGKPFAGEPAPGNGQMVALLASDRAMVDVCHALAIGLGGSCEGPPGLRPQYHPDYYGAYFRDLSGNKLCVCCHDPA